MKYYVVRAKCGHVGRNNYIIKKFYVKAETGEDAAKTVRSKPRVKHHRKDAIQSVNEITKEMYFQGLKEMQEDKYFSVHSKQQQIKCEAVNECEVFRETKEETAKYKKTHLGQQLRYEILEKEWKRYYSGGS
jgi:hypothetical protein